MALKDESHWFPLPSLVPVETASRDAEDGVRSYFENADWDSPVEAELGVGDGNDGIVSCKEDAAFEGHVLLKHWVWNGEGAVRHSDYSSEISAVLYRKLKRVFTEECGSDYWHFAVIIDE